ncbi:MAG: DEAD/DEAH box helicase [Arachnia sp.]
MDRQERERLRAQAAEVERWVARARQVQLRRTQVREAAASALARVLRCGLDVRMGDAGGWRVFPLRPDAGRLLGDLAAAGALPPLSPSDDAAVTVLTTELAQAVTEVKVLFGLRRFFSGGREREAGLAAARLIAAYRSRPGADAVPTVLERLVAEAGRAPSEVPLDDALRDEVGLIGELGRGSDLTELLPGALVHGLPRACEAIGRAQQRVDLLREGAVAVGGQLRRLEADKVLRDMPVERLRDTTRDRVRTGPLTDAGVTTVGQVRLLGARLEQIPGIGEKTAKRLLGAAQTLWQTTYDDLPLRLDPRQRTPEATALLARLAAWDAARRALGAPPEPGLFEAFAPLAREIDGHVTRLIVQPRGRAVSAFVAAVDQLLRWADRLPGPTAARGEVDPWADFQSRPADYYAMLSELGFLTEDERKAHGDLPEDILEAVRALPLDTTHLRVSLRGYQSFAAKFALVQRKVLIGDEMGLGKTVEALALLAHLTATGRQHGLVVCPAAVVTNWVREIESKSTLSAHRLHGPGRSAAARAWVDDGGVAVTTFETLGSVAHTLNRLRDLPCVIVDEAHYIKNPAAQRSQRTSALVRRAQHAVLMTGTPLENRVDEFGKLVGYLRPDLVVDGDTSPVRFRRQVAPAYLRRNQEDVLSELPELVETDEWLPLSPEDEQAYAQAVEAGNFMAMRQAAMLAGPRSEKIRRLVEIVAEAEANGRRVIVFSHFLKVLDTLAECLPGQVFGPLTGSVAAGARQVMVDRFQEADRGAVLVSQIQAGGVGLNIQRASVVVICEPQLKPTTEWQAIARAHRMGQLDSVQVHRLLSEEGVDQRIADILARKRQTFAHFARESDTADSAPEAVDVSELQIAREVVALERQRLFPDAPGPQQGVPEITGSRA